MFTGLVEEMGRFGGRHGRRYRFSARTVLVGVFTGDSVAVDGVCLTVVDHGPDWFEVEVVRETLSRTTLGQLATGERVNLERSLALGDRLGGHLVQGHVDAVGAVVRAAPDLVVEVVGSDTRYLAEKGSVAIDGVSLTVVSVDAPCFSVAIVGHTAAVTTLGLRQVGDRVNLEFDVVAKYVERLLGFTRD